MSGQPRNVTQYIFAIKTLEINKYDVAFDVKLDFLLTKNDPVVSLSNTTLSCIELNV